MTTSFDNAAQSEDRGTTVRLDTRLQAVQRRGVLRLLEYAGWPPARVSSRGPRASEAEWFSAPWGYVSTVLSVNRLLARARLDDSPAALARAKAQAAGGDESWEQWVAEYHRGEALIVRLELMMEVSDGVSRVIRATREGLFVENDVHAPRIEKQIAELASGDFAALGAELVRPGHDVDEYEFGELYVHVELDEELRLRLSRAASHRTPGRSVSD